MIEFNTAHDTLTHLIEKLWSNKGSEVFLIKDETIFLCLSNDKWIITILFLCTLSLDNGLNNALEYQLSWKNNFLFGLV